jgi:hypothetical protein
MQALSGDNATLKRRYTTVELREQVGRAPEDRDMATARVGVEAANAMLDAYAADRRR